MATLSLYTDIQRSVLFSSSTGRWCYSPFGTGCPNRAGRLGYVGVYVEPVAALQAFGNGYRAYSALMMRFLWPDRCSPFGEGGVNAYAYCLADPVNRIDHSGQFSTALTGPLLTVAINTLTLGALGALQVDRQPKGYLRRSTQVGALAALVGVGGAIWRMVDSESSRAQVMMWSGTGAGIVSAGFRNLHYWKGIRAQKVNMREAVSRLSRLMPGFGIGFKPRSPLWDISMF
ncbi:RHS repeat-associated core domain-containing protein [Pseudomonas sp. KNUC1026]|uniref:RHS repeat-associated core domain-containing protein n=1 Tax=Pseudomonas sp. KNUC1026 TaxID=2893890 RepID=UPI001F2B5B24|nr:RHS repeat-associated core domain-containing protein [Pseudomonas sp. KNUC1026]UFH48895.1 RHS repeat-associated core domain-containing protein [Pseudomonas sp. KNUC1026]